MGATVVKVEKPKDGDHARAWGPPFLHGESLWFMSVNRGKHSVTLDISCAQGQEILHKLVVQCDVILLNLVGRVQGKLGLDAVTLRALNPRLIHLSLTGFGLHGHRADMLAVHDEAMAVIDALFCRQREGVGCDMDVSMVESMSRFMAPRIMLYLGSGEFSRSFGGRDSVIAIYQVFETADDPIARLGKRCDMEALFAGREQPEMSAKQAYASNAQCRTARPVLVKVIVEVLREKPRSHRLGLFTKARVHAGPIQRLDELARDRALHSAGFIYRNEGPDGQIPPGGTWHTVRRQYRRRQHGSAQARRAYEVDSEHWLGCPSTHIKKLRASRVI